MMNPIALVVSKIKDAIWKYQFKRTPTEHLGILIVKYFRGSYYCVGIDSVRERTLQVLKTLPRDGNYGPVLALIETLEGQSLD